MPNVIVYFKLLIKSGNISYTPCKLNNRFLNDKEERKWHVQMKIALHPPPPLLPPPSFLPWLYLTLLSIFLPSRFIFEDYTPTNFDTFPASIMTVFQVWLPQIPSFCLLSMTHCTLGYFSPQAQIKQLSSLALHPLPPLSSHTTMHTYAHMNIRNVNKSTSDLLQKPTALWKSVLINTNSNYLSPWQFKYHILNGFAYKEYIACLGNF